jgi:hypothetical protein
LGESVPVSWVYYATGVPALPAATKITFNLVDLRLGADKGVPFYTYSNNAVAISATTASFILPSDLPIGKFSFATTIVSGGKSYYFSSPVFYVNGNPNYRPPFSGPAISINYPDK